MFELPPDNSAENLDRGPVDPEERKHFLLNEVLSEIETRAGELLPDKPPEHQKDVSPRSADISEPKDWSALNQDWTDARSEFVSALEQIRRQDPVSYMLFNNHVRAINANIESFRLLIGDKRLSGDIIYNFNKTVLDQIRLVTIVINRRLAK